MLNDKSGTLAQPHSAGQIKQQPSSMSQPSNPCVQELFYCPITQSILVDPVIAADGHTYERAAMVKRLQHCMTSPVTGDMLPHPLLVPNFAVKAMITNQCLRA